MASEIIVGVIGLWIIACLTILIVLIIRNLRRNKPDE